MRIRSRWNVKGKERSPEETASALAFIAWRIACNGVLSLENEGFQTDTQRQRLDVIGEFAAFLVHVTDRLTYERFGAEERAQLIGGMGRRVLEFWQDNMRDAVGPGDYLAELAERLNTRMGEYAEFDFVDGEPSFAFTRYLGDRVTAHMGSRAQQWIMEQVMQVEAPEALKTLRKGLKDLLPE